MNVLIVGLGSIGLKHAEAMRKLIPDLKLYALRASRNPSVQDDNIISLYSWDEIIFQPDFIIISNPTIFHGQTILSASSFKCPLFIEKPVLHSLEEADEILSIIARDNILTYVACNLRFHPVIKYFKERIVTEKPMIQEVNIYCGSYLPDWRKNRDYSTTYSARKELGGGVHLDLIHELDYCCWLFGNPLAAVTIRRKVSTLDIDVPDSACYLLTYPSFTANIVLNYFRRDSKRNIEMLTKDNTVYGDLLAAKIDKAGHTEFEWTDYSVLQTYTDQMAYFLEHIAAGTQPMNSFGEAVNILNIALQ